MNYAYIRHAVRAALKQLKLPIPPGFTVEQIKRPEFGDMATNVAMGLARTLKKNPIELAEQIAKQIAKSEKESFAKVEAVKPGFVNFWLHPRTYASIVRPFLKKSYKAHQLPKAQRRNINFEYVSANPTGALHLGHVRNAYVGDSLTNILRAIGHKVTTEYWLNNMGRQIEFFEMSVLVRYLELFGKKIPLPEEGYKGEDPYKLAAKLKEKHGDKYVNVVFDEKKGFADKKAERELWSFCIDAMVEQIKEHLASIGVKLSVWTSEDKIYHSPLVEELLANGEKKNLIYRSEGALWLRTTDGGEDDKDRVLVKSDGSRTYFITDIANQYNKRIRGFDYFLHVWGSDHEGHVRRMKSAMPIIGARASQMRVILIQMVKLFKGGQELKLSKRAGMAITIPDMLSMMSVDNSRWHILAQATRTTIVLNLEQVQKADSSNPVYYVQYAHARLCSLLRGLDLAGKPAPREFDLLDSQQDRELVNALMAFEPTLFSAAKSYEPHRLTGYLSSLAKALHAWYEAHNLKKAPEGPQRRQRCFLALAAKQAIAYALNLLGISAPAKMEQAENVPQQVA